MSQAENEERAQRTQREAPDDRFKARKEPPEVEDFGNTCEVSMARYEGLLDGPKETPLSTGH